MEGAQVSTSQHLHSVVGQLRLVPVGQPPDRGCGYFEVTGHVLCAKVNSVGEHDKALDLVEGFDAPHLLDPEGRRFEQGDFGGHGCAFRARERQGLPCPRAAGVEGAHGCHLLDDRSAGDASPMPAFP